MFVLFLAQLAKNADRLVQGNVVFVFLLIIQKV